jgi:serine/threonine protein phosphatase 1
MPASDFLLRLFGSATATGRRLAFDRDPAAIYAIGDVHGCLDLLLRLEAAIVADAETIPGDVWLLLLGDVIDRGPNPAGVIEHLLAPPPARFSRYCLMGNHEDMMLDFLARPSPAAPWLDNGGYETLRSYGVPDTALYARNLGDLALDAIPSEHAEFIAELPVAIETPGFLFVHAGVRPGTPIASQSRQDLLWYRDNYASDFGGFPKPIVHGHTPRRDPLVLPRRIALDTGACFTGRLTAARLVPGRPPVLISEAARHG